MCQNFLIKNVISNIGNDYWLDCFGKIKIISGFEINLSHTFEVQGSNPKTNRRSRKNVEVLPESVTTNSEVTGSESSVH